MRILPSLLCLLLMPALGPGSESPCPIALSEPLHSASVYEVGSNCSARVLSPVITPVVPLQLSTDLRWGADVKRQRDGGDGGAAPEPLNGREANEPQFYLGLLCLESGRLTDRFPEDKVRTEIRRGLGPEQAERFTLYRITNKAVVRDEEITFLLEGGEELSVIILGVEDDLLYRHDILLNTDDFPLQEGVIVQFATIGSVFVFEFHRLFTSREVFVFNRDGTMIASYSTSVPLYVAGDQTAWLVHEGKVARITEDGSIEILPTSDPAPPCRPDLPLQLNPFHEDFAVIDDHALHFRVSREGEFSLCATVLSLYGSEQHSFALRRDDYDIDSMRFIDHQIDEGIFWVVLSEKKAPVEPSFMEEVGLPAYPGSPPVFWEFAYTLYQIDIHEGSIKDLDELYYGRWPVAFRVH